MHTPTRLPALSQVHNRFLEELGRFPSIEEDEAPYRLLVSDYGALA